jgi:cell division protease FtsH
MVCDWGMSELGPLAFGGGSEPVFLGRDYTQRTEYSENTAQRIDQEVDRLVRDGHESARKILDENREVLDRLAKILLETESVSGLQVYELIEEITGRDLTPEDRQPPPLPPAAPPAVAEPKTAVTDDAPGDMEPAPATRARTSETLESR